jgi:hypothetical protein
MSSSTTSNAPTWYYIKFGYVFRREGRLSGKLKDRKG